MVSSPAQHARVHIDQLVAGGDGLAREASGRVVFVPGVLPGEDVSVRFVSAKRDFARAEVRELLDPSPARVEAPCAARRRGCGGCDWQHADPAAQLGFKVDIVREALRRTARLPDANVVAGGSVQPWAYRTSMRVALDEHGRVALHRARSSELVALEQCLVAHPLLDDLIARVRLRGVEEISLRVSAATGERSAWWDGDAVIGAMPDDVGLGPDSIVNESVAGVTLQVSAASFFQSGPQAAELLADTVRAMITDHADARQVVDAYGGVGLFAATVVARDASIAVVESSGSACADARINLTDRDATVVCSTVERWTPERCDLVIADPARQGLGRDAVDVLVATNAATMVLVACDPVSMARDASLLAAAGYALTATVVVDLFPQTHHVEVVARFDRRSGAVQGFSLRPGFDARQS